MESITYELTEDDLVAFNVLNLRLSPLHARWLRFRLMLLALISIAAWTVVTVMLGRPNTFAWLILAAGAALIILLPRLHWLLLPRTIRKHLRTGSSRGTIGEQRLELHEARLARVHAQSSAQFAWSAFEKLVATRNYLLLYIAPGQAFIVPRRTFTPDEESGFRSRVERLSGMAFAEVLY